MKIIHLLTCLLVTGTCAQAQILSFDFNKISGSPPTESTSSGTSPLKEINKAPKDGDKKEKYRSKNGEGVTGQPGDYALDFRSATLMGGDGVGGTAVVPGTNEALAGLRSFTLCGWYKVEEPAGFAARIFEMYNYATQGFFLAVNEGNLALEVNKHRVISKDLDYSTINQWVFFSAAFNGLATRQNVTFYVGTKEKGLKSVTLDLPVETPLPLAGSERDGTLTMGNSSGERPFKGLLDNLAVYGSSTDASGCLSEAQVKELFHGVVSQMAP